MSKSIRVNIEGIEYPSVGEATRSLKMNRNTVDWRIMSPLDRWSKWFRMDEEPTGFKHSYIYPSGDKFRANYKRKYLGTYESLEDAQQAINEYKKETGNE